MAHALGPQSRFLYNLRCAIFGVHYTSTCALWASLGKLASVPRLTTSNPGFQAIEALGFRYLGLRTQADDEQYQIQLILVFGLRYLGLSNLSIYLGSCT